MPNTNETTLNPLNVASIDLDLLSAERTARKSNVTKTFSEVESLAIFVMLFKFGITLLSQKIYGKSFKSGYKSLLKIEKDLIAKHGSRANVTAQVKAKSSEVTKAMNSLNSLHTETEVNAIREAEKLAQKKIRENKAKETK